MPGIIDFHIGNTLSLQSVCNQHHGLIGMRHTRRSPSPPEMIGQQAHSLTFFTRCSAPLKGSFEHGQKPADIVSVLFNYIPAKGLPFFAQGIQATHLFHLTSALHAVVVDYGNDVGQL